MRTKIQLAVVFALAIITPWIGWKATAAQERRSQATGSAAPDSTTPAEFIFPRIQEHGKVVRLPKAVDQPREGSKICVDATAGGPADKVNPAIDKVARFVNIYAGAGASPAKVQITVILHGDATLAALSDSAYAAKFSVAENPNRGLFRQLADAGVELLVCGQALHHKGAVPEDITSSVDVAVSALTVNVNRQMDGYAYIPLH